MTGEGTERYRDTGKVIRRAEEDDMKATWRLGLMGMCAVLGASASGSAAIVASGVVGTAAPPAMLGPYSMTVFPDDTQPEVAIVTGVPSPLGGTLGFSRSPEHFDIPV